ncbi:cell division ATP-binding protein FtsE [Wenzhouxiangella marina]|uniref:Cell division ATP-binding protein FtsE n=1 Tax=Wenzhouxiangella marina TaxID=1579979 RepID=A0A0K0XX58_9GAMM|nr:cell division ATP-binding protein FtsE [Wenzhouxiangella marina]AKS42265.1 Cell division ATP-binding protein FtsE [Wenzhouxiangella marina]MBB6085962.1 cell division transport system ATP-binding protein [Wenzhouxiangella marina]
MIRFEHVAKRYPGGIQALSDVNFSLEKGELAFLTGHSGAGKSTLLRLIALLERPSRGQVMFDGRNVGKLARRHIPYLRRRIGVIFQDHRLLSDKKVFDNVALPLMIAGVSYGEIKRRVRAALDKVGLLEKENMYPPMLSGGQQQRVGIARAIIGKPPLLLADEPTGNLDPEMSAELMNYFLQLNELGVTVLIASHDLELIRQLGRRVLVLKDGEMIDDLPSRQIYTGDAHGTV